VHFPFDPVSFGSKEKSELVVVELSLVSEQKE
jgi:hypothetical protein